jgi:hypothetical protein
MELHAEEPEPVRSMETSCSDAEYAEIERWVIAKIKRKLDEWKKATEETR